MRKLTDTEQNAINWLNRVGSICFNAQSNGFVEDEVRSVLDSLVKKKRAYVEPTDDGPRYHLTAQGRADAA